MSVLPVASGRQTWRGLCRSALSHPGDLAAAVVWTLTASIGVVVVPVLLGRCVDAVRVGSSSDLPLLLPALVITALLGAVLTALAQRSTARLGAQIAADIREQALTAALDLDPGLLEPAGSGDVTSRVTEDVETFVAAIPLVAAVSTAGSTLLVAVTAVAGLDWRLALAFVVVLPFYAFGLSRYLPRSGPLYAQERRASAERGRVLLESLHGRPTVAAYGMADLQTRRVEEASGHSLELRVRTIGLSLWLTKSMNAAEAAGLSTILLTGYWLVHDDVVSVGAVTAAALLFHRLFDPLGTLLNSFDQVQRAGAALARIIGVALVPARQYVDAPPPQGAVALHVSQVRHSYDGVHDVVADIDLEVPAGSSLALVGTSGAGKSTLAGILTGMFPPTGGTAVLTDGRTRLTVAEVAPAQLRDWIALVSQETHVFSGTLRDDVAFAAPGRTDNEIRESLNRVGALGWVTALPAGLDTRVGPGGQHLSPVQDQQLALARIVLRDPPVVVMDEATAEAGSAGARDLEHAATALLSGRTAIVVAHRLSQARVCDRIAVMDHGRVVEIGSHEELLTMGGRYARLWTAWSRTSKPPARQ
ncbi:ABC transporter ATP-binding protein [Kineosporia babensis]|uniref:ABC transporter ATP-binding protein/permease n=1 Tax=Kineosporia babensis TaxID=499548 RepID=A0A9X1NHH3_9ACTN|nr:ABC transporter ATP-binding protein [Kineosporia babensis]MCD5314070.1 ABC transporter ATP-binding protein/permease [Kineosporia babensis]